MDKKIKQDICERIADGEKLFFFDEGKYGSLNNDHYYDIENGQEIEKERLICSLPYLNLKTEAINFIMEHKDLYYKDFSSFIHKFKEVDEAAWQLLVYIDDSEDTNSWEDFYIYRLKKSERLFNCWIKQNIYLIRKFL